MVATVNPNLHTFSTIMAENGVASAPILGEKHPIRVFSAWISEMGNFQNTCKLANLATKLLREFSYVQASTGLFEGLEKAGNLFEKLRDAPAITYFADRVTHLFRPDPDGKKKSAEVDTRSIFGVVKDSCDALAMGILTVNIFSPVFNSSWGSKLMPQIDYISFAGDVAEVGKFVVDLSGSNKPKEGDAAKIFYLKMLGAFLSATSCLGKVLNATLKREVAPPLVLTITSFASTSLKLYASYSDYAKPDGVVTIPKED